MDHAESHRAGLRNTGKKNLRRLSVLITAQTQYNLERLAQMGGCWNLGRVIDKLTREKMLSLRLGREEGGRE